MKQPFIWDYYSDQPYPLKDKAYKKKMRKKEYLSLLKTFFISILVIPFALLLTPFVKRKFINSEEFFCLGVDFQREPQESLKLIKELEIKSLLFRIKLWEIDTLDELKNFLIKLSDKKITLKILQDREHIEDLELLEEKLKLIFSSLKEYVNIFEIASTVNRAKWGFFSIDEYNRFFQVAYDLQQKTFPSIKLIGSGVIDFEYHFTAHTLFNLSKYKYNGISALLYVDRRGAPENAQMAFNLSDKISLLSTMVWLSPKVGQELHITETNWPLSHTAPYAPTSEVECVDTDLYTDFMLRYYFLAFASQQIDSVSWHQLIASGYGLVDNRNEIKKYPAFEAYKFMLKTLKNAQFLRLDIKRGYYILQCLIEDKLLQIHWSLKPTTLQREEYFSPYFKDGRKNTEKILHINSSPVYIFITT